MVSVQRYFVIHSVQVKIYAASLLSLECWHRTRSGLLDRKGCSLYRRSDVKSSMTSNNVVHENAIIEGKQVHDICFVLFGHKEDGGMYAFTVQFR